MDEKGMAEQESLADGQSIVAHQAAPPAGARSIGREPTDMIERPVAMRREGFAHVVLERAPPLQFAARRIAIAQCSAEIGAEKELRSLAKQFLAI